MHVAILGGTGDIGEGLAVRFADAGHHVHVGSRDAGKGEEKAAEYAERTGEDVVGGTNADAARQADAVVVGVPYEYSVDTLEGVADALPEGAPVVAPVVPMRRTEDGDFVYDPPAAGSATAELRDAAPDGNPVAGAFHNLAANRLAHLDAELGVDVAVCGDPDAKATAVELADSVEGLRGLDVGGFAVASMVEGLTPLLIDVAMKNDMHDLGVRFR
mgnify:CR=1 FL=1